METYKMKFKVTAQELAIYLILEAILARLLYK